MRILQLIDTLHPGGAERMAVNYANALQEYGHSSFMVVTREEGSFIPLLNNNVGYFFLGKKYTFDFLALKNFIGIVKENKIDLIHAHGTSWFFGVLCKMLNKEVKLVWHDHYGKSEFLENRDLQPLKIFSKFFDGIIVVNEKLKIWDLEKLLCPNVLFLNNFIEIPSDASKGNEAPEFIELVCLANFRPQKDHYTLLKACDKIKEIYNIRLNLIGKSFHDSYSKELEKELGSRTYIKYHGEVNDPSNFLANMQIGLLSSESEGLPLALLEYGANSLAIVCTNVGYNQEVIGDHGILFRPGDDDALSSAIMDYIKNHNKRTMDGRELKKRIKLRYSKESVLNSYLQFIKNI